MSLVGCPNCIWFIEAVVKCIVSTRFEAGLATATFILLIASRWLCYSRRIPSLESAGTGFLGLVSSLALQNSVAEPRKLSPSLPPVLMPGWADADVQRRRILLSLLLRPERIGVRPHPTHFRLEAKLAGRSSIRPPHKSYEFIREDWPVRHGGAGCARRGVWSSIGLCYLQAHGT